MTVTCLIAYVTFAVLILTHCCSRGFVATFVGLKASTNVMSHDPVKHHIYFRLATLDT